jgi:hypothetical protein
MLSLAGILLLAAGCGAAQPNRPVSRGTQTGMRPVTVTISPDTSVRLEVPAAWRARRVGVGDTSGTAFQDAKDPSEQVDVVSTGCVGCMQDKEGRWDVQSLFGSPDVHWTSVSGSLLHGRFIDRSHSDPFKAAGQRRDPFVARGIATILPVPTSLAVEVEVWAPAGVSRRVLAAVRVQPAATEAGIAQLVRWSRLHELYAVTWPTDLAYASQPPQQIYLLPKGFRIPAVLQNWPPKRFRPIALVDDPPTEIGTGTGTLWNQMQTSIYWLKPASSAALPPAGANLGLAASQAAVLTVPPGHLFAVPWPSATEPHRTIFLASVGFAMPTVITAWPPANFRIVAVYPMTAAHEAPELQYAVRPLTPAPGVSIPRP